MRYALRQSSKLIMKKICLVFFNIFDSFSQEFILQQVMKTSITIAIITTLLPLLLTTPSPKYQLKIYWPPECNYCIFAAAQIRSLIAQYHWSNVLQLVDIDCAERGALCRDTSKGLLIVMEEETKTGAKRKLGEIGGVKSKLFWRDWIAGFVDRNPVMVEVKEREGDPYKRIVVKNVEEIAQFFHNKVDRLNKIRQDRLNSIKVPDIQPQKHGEKQEIKKQNTEDDKGYGNFRDDLRKLAMIAAPATFIVILIVLIRSRNQSSRRRYRLPINENEPE